MLRRSPRALLLWIAAAIVAVATAAYVADVLVSLRHQDEAYGRVRPVVVAARDLPLGHRVRASDLAARHLRGDVTDALTHAASAVGEVVRVPLLRGALVTARHLAPKRRDGRDGTVPAGLRSMRVEVEGGVQPDPGDPVDIYATFDPQTVGEGVEPTLTVADAVPVLATDHTPGSTGASGALGVTVLVTPPQAKRLAFAAAAGTLAIAVAPPEATRREPLASDP
jgi:Flp pilus assembly protein CpaB